MKVKALVLGLLFCGQLFSQNQSIYFVSKQDKFSTNIECKPQIQYVQGMRSYKCTSSYLRAIFRVNVSPIQSSNDFSSDFINSFFSEYRSNLRSNGVTYTNGTYKGLKTVEYVHNTSGVWVKQIVFLNYGRSYTLSVMGDSRVRVDELMIYLKNNFSFL